MNLPPIAPLTRKEAEILRLFRDDLASRLDRFDRNLMRTTTEYMDAMLERVDEALGEYDQRAVYRRWMTPSADHRMRARAWMDQMRPSTGDADSWTVVNTVAHLEPWMDRAELADHLGCSVRWIRYRQAEGMPHALIAGRVKFRASEVEPWLERHGHLKRHGEAA